MYCFYATSGVLGVQAPAPCVLVHHVICYLKVSHVEFEIMPIQELYISSVHGRASDWIAACSVRSKREREGRAFRMLMSFQAILCPVVREYW